MAKQSNAQLWNALRASNPSFKSHTSEGTASLFTERGFSQLAQTDPRALSDFFGLSTRAALQIVNISHAQDPLASSGVGETFDAEYGGIIQRMATQSVKPTSPRYKGLQNGKSVDRWTVRKPETLERFWRQNFDYQSYVTLQEFDMKQIFVSEYGMSEYLAGIVAGLENGYTVQRYVNKLECLHQGLKDPNLKTSQIVPITIKDLTDQDQMTAFLYSVASIISAMRASAQTRCYNAMGYADVQDIGRLKLLVRAGWSAALRMYTLAGTYNPADLDLGVDVVEVENFGGITYTNAAGAALYPVYDTDGAQIGWSTTVNATEAEYEDGDDTIVALDPHADVHAVLLDKGWMFESIQNGYRVMPTGLNEAGLYENFWASAPNNSINYDRLYNFVVFKNPEQPTEQPTEKPTEQSKAAAKSSKASK